MPTWKECLAKSVHARGCLRPSHNPNTPAVWGVQARAQLASLSLRLLAHSLWKGEGGWCEDRKSVLSGEAGGTAGDETSAERPQEGPSCTQT